MPCLVLPDDALDKDRWNALIACMLQPLKQLFWQASKTLVWCYGLGLCAEWLVAQEPAMTVRVQVDLSQSMGPLRPIWRYFGADEPNYAYMKDGSKLLGELGELAPGEVFFRAHNLLTSGDGTPALKWGSTGVYHEDANGNPSYDWNILDRIFDTYLERGVRPYVEIGFMPQALSVKPEPYQHEWAPGAPYEKIYTGWAHPPRDHEKWQELVRQWTHHCVERYGAEEVNHWYWETWNEANIPYWQGSRDGFLKLHDYAIAGVREALPTARVGGPDCAGPGGDFMRAFLDHCLTGTNYVTGEIGTPLDFVAFHAKGSPKFVDGHVQMGMANQLRNIRDGFALVASYPELRDTPIIIGESDPEGCAACQGPQLAYRNGTMYSSYTAASFMRKMDLADRYQVRFDGALSWAFEFEGHPQFAGFRSLASGGINKPVLNVFRMFSMMKGQRVQVISDHQVPLDEILEKGIRQQADVAGLASLQDDQVWILLWHYHDDDLPGPVAEIALNLKGLPTDARWLTMDHYRIDHEHSNAWVLWKAMGSPATLSQAQYNALDARDGLEIIEQGVRFEVTPQGASLPCSLPRQGVSLLVVKVPTP